MQLSKRHPIFFSMLSVDPLRTTLDAPGGILAALVSEPAPGSPRVRLSKPIENLWFFVTFAPEGPRGSPEGTTDVSRASSRAPRDAKGLPRDPEALAITAIGFQESCHSTKPTLPTPSRSIPFSIFHGTHVHSQVHYRFSY